MGSFRSYEKCSVGKWLGCVLQGLLNCKSWVTVRSGKCKSCICQKKTQGGITFSGRRSIVGGSVLRAVAGRCACSPLVFCFLLLGVRVSPAAGWRCAMRIAGVRVAWVALCHADCWCACCVGGAVPCGLLVCVSRGWRCAMGIAGVRVAWVALCHGECWRACRVGGAVPWGLLVCVSRGWRCAMGIAGVRVAWVALCHGDCWWSRGWRCAMRIAGVRVAWAALCHGDCWWACRVGGARPWGLLLGVSRGGAVAWGLLLGVSRGSDRCWACRVGGAVPCGLVVGVSRGRRRVEGIADRAFVWVAPCLWDR